jgi:hypothetical protein
MIRSFRKYHPDQEILISENSTNEDTVKVLDGLDIEYIRMPESCHSPSVDSLIREVKTDYVLLVDTDVLFYTSQDAIYNKIIEDGIDLCGTVCGDRGGKKIHTKIHPWYCWINVKRVKELGINFNDPNRLGFVKTSDKIYDVGSSFFEDCISNNLKLRHFDGQDLYYYHYEGMSWRVQKYDPNKPEGDIDIDSTASHNNKQLYEYGRYIYEKYKKDVQERMYFSECNI